MFNKAQGGNQFLKMPPIAVLIAALFLPQLAEANGGLPIIFMVNAYAFLFGAVLVFLIELAYLKRLAPEVGFKQLVLCVFKFNLYSTLAGVFIIPAVFLLLRIDPVIWAIFYEPSEATMNFVWWSSLILDFVLAYAATIYIEYRTLKTSKVAEVLEERAALIRHVLQFNALSYGVLIIIAYHGYQQFF
ncbi:hypothetical protein [uncultured Pseudoteredinibacter sp.]|uniref:hypothetical protein n=1 Tax=uncultured Pseudoteredinibacter sp. TaxID=1641701 RepID=UPI0026093A2C|nr:hypothetical protein [uncultured Pseudoteredinibacter sp.]